MLDLEEQEAASGLERHVGYWLRFVSNHVSHEFSRRVSAQGVTVAEWVVLRALLDRSDCAPSRLAGDLGMTRGAISKLVDRLAAKRLVEKRQVGRDRRFQQVSLTSAGRRLIPELAAEADRNDDVFFGHLGLLERENLIALLRDVVARHGLKEVPVD
ncbi:MarR family winged helix-turn-helix transcriptional regulator [Sphingosinicella sp. CPCC 101087]|uniref:MarR family winged helix-turn-helix transcriptional regulator n=1 Tax=Sphingosinicella sp. CPCC 101087 TaxID=2497754 RepID=UPI00101CBE0A|nr:MarR family winged helix-turn-helix transcriptional regulator [Sphingosinicella sp. CPCC 101087]